MGEILGEVARGFAQTTPFGSTSVSFTFGASVPVPANGRLNSVILWIGTPKLGSNPSFSVFDTAGNLYTTIQARPYSYATGFSGAVPAFQVVVAPVQHAIVGGTTQLQIVVGPAVGVWIVAVAVSGIYLATTPSGFGTDIGAGGTPYISMGNAGGPGDKQPPTAPNGSYAITSNLGTSSIQAKELLVGTVCIGNSSTFPEIDPDGSSLSPGAGWTAITPQLSGFSGPGASHYGIYPLLQFITAIGTFEAGGGVSSNQLRWSAGIKSLLAFDDVLPRQPHLIRDYTRNLFLYYVADDGKLRQRRYDPSDVQKDDTALDSGADNATPSFYLREGALVGSYLKGSSGFVMLSQDHGGQYFSFAVPGTWDTALLSQEWKGRIVVIGFRSGTWKCVVGRVERPAGAISVVWGSEGTVATGTGKGRFQEALNGELPFLYESSVGAWSLALSRSVDKDGSATWYQTVSVPGFWDSLITQEWKGSLVAAGWRQSIPGWKAVRADMPSPGAFIWGAEGAVVSGGNGEGHLREAEDGDLDLAYREGADWLFKHCRNLKLDGSGTWF